MLTLEHGHEVKGLSFPTLWCDPRRLDATFGGVMGKYTEQAKLAAVKEYCAGKAGLRDV
ncbi:hypothetical protein GIV96_23135, partial [Pseudomonas syringae]|nr:hypothetical protein [Pseudomonas syringae]MCF5316381.1 hypothetical protein [Pseudomonas syringae]MCF5361905.1 hypothetical protein [Pseudomonas syringae]MCF5397239.1 hypothetical protein [Pseudomonas syringae]MCF5402893.1 hypothetical protein [Pseudomonas syringae]